MYSVVVLMTMTATTEAPDFGRRSCRTTNRCERKCAPVSHGCCGKVIVIDGGKKTTPDGGKKTTPDGGKKTTPDGGKKTTPDGGKKTTPDGGKKTTPDGGKKTTPDGGKKTTPDGGKKTTPDGGKKTTPDGGSVRIEIQLPSAGQLTIDDYVVPQISNRHTFITAPLAQGQQREITFKTSNAVKTVTVTAGQSIEVNLTPGNETVAAR